MLKLIELINKMFDNVEKILKWLCKICFFFGIITAIVTFFLAFVEDEDFIFFSIISACVAIASIPLYVLPEILAQLKLLNSKSK